MNKGWIGVDLDGTLAHYLPEEWQGIEHIGHPIPAMISRVHTWLLAGMDVRIVTARAAEGEKVIQIIQDWLEIQGLPRLPVTDKKDWQMIELWDDRVVRVETNTGRIL